MARPDTDAERTLRGALEANRYQELLVRHARDALDDGLGRQLGAEALGQVAPQVIEANAQG